MLVSLLQVRTSIRQQSGGMVPDWRRRLLCKQCRLYIWRYGGHQHFGNIWLLWGWSTSFRGWALPVTFLPYLCAANMSFASIRAGIWVLSSRMAGRHGQGYPTQGRPFLVPQSWGLICRASWGAPSPCLLTDWALMCCSTWTWGALSFLLQSWAACICWWAELAQQSSRLAQHGRLCWLRTACPETYPKTMHIASTVSECMLHCMRIDTHKSLSVCPHADGEATLWGDTGMVGGGQCSSVVCGEQLGRPRGWTHGWAWEGHARHLRLLLPARLRPASHAPSRPHLPPRPKVRVCPGFTPLHKPSCHDCYGTTTNLHDNVELWRHDELLISWFAWVVLESQYLCMHSFYCWWLMPVNVFTCNM